MVGALVSQAVRLGGGRDKLRRRTPAAFRTRWRSSVRNAGVRFGARGPDPPSTRGGPPRGRTDGGPTLGKSTGARGQGYPLEGPERLYRAHRPRPVSPGRDFAMTDSAGPDIERHLNRITQGSLVRRRRPPDGARSRAGRRSGWRRRTAGSRLGRTAELAGFDAKRRPRCRNEAGHRSRRSSTNVSSQEDISTLSKCDIRPKIVACACASIERRMWSA